MTLTPLFDINPQQLLDKVRIVLVNTSHPGNVGACARAMKTMGLTQLVLVAPRFDDVLQHEEAIAMASGAGDVLAQALYVPNLAAGLEGVSFALALSARMRDLGPVILNARQGAQAVVEHALGVAQQPVALVFGPERAGLLNDDLLLCHRQVMIDANPQYSSLNLSQAVQVLCYELRQAVFTMIEPTQQERVEPLIGDAPPTASIQHASVDQVQRLFQRMQDAMAVVGFLNPEQPKKLTSRLQRLLAKAELEMVEVDLLLGFMNDVIRVAEKRLYPHEATKAAQALKPPN